MISLSSQSINPRRMDRRHTTHFQILINLLFNRGRHFEIVYLHSLLQREEEEMENYRKTLEADSNLSLNAVQRLDLVKRKSSFRKRFDEDFKLQSFIENFD
jgi:hypothetical protein